MAGLVLPQFQRLAMGLVGADEILQRGFQTRDCVFGLADFLFQVMNATFHLLALDGIQALLESFGLLVARTIAIGRPAWGISRKIPSSPNRREKWGTLDFG